MLTEALRALGPSRGRARRGDVGRSRRATAAKTPRSRRTRSSSARSATSCPATASSSRRSARPASPRLRAAGLRAAHVRLRRPPGDARLRVPDVARREGGAPGPRRRVGHRRRRLPVRAAGAVARPCRSGSASRRVVRQQRVRQRPARPAAASTRAARSPPGCTTRTWLRWPSPTASPPRAPRRPRNCAPRSTTPSSADAPALIHVPVDPATERSPWPLLMPAGQ